MVNAIMVGVAVYSLISLGAPIWVAVVIAAIFSSF